MNKNRYGYKVCYKEFNRHKLRIHLVCNSYDLAIWELQYYKTNLQYDRKTNCLIQQPSWFIFPIKNYYKYKRLWKDCPF